MSPSSSTSFSFTTLTNAMPISPSPSISPSLTPYDNISRKRQRSESMESQPSSSSKRSISVDPSQEPSQAQNPLDPSPFPTPDATQDEDIDAYMAEQGEATIPTTLDGAIQPQHDPQSNGTVTSVETTGADRLAQIERLCKEAMVPGETWFLISVSWYKRWQKACSGFVDKEGGVTEEELGPVNNSSLVDGIGNLLKPPIEHVDVEFVPEEAWRKFVHWYGQPWYPLPRKVIVRGIMKEPNLEVMPPRLKAHRLAFGEGPYPQQSPAYVTVSSTDTVETLVNALARSVLASEGNTSKRVWKLPEGAAFQYLEYPAAKLKGGAKLLDINASTTVEDALIEAGDAFVVEFQVDGGWIAPTPDQVSGASTPQSTASGTQPSTKLFGTNFFDQLQAKSSGSFTDASKSGAGAATTLKPAMPIKAGPSMLTRSKAPKVEPGTLGLGNMGNTCFMNSAIQCLAHTKELTDYFLTGVFEEELNPDNPLGMHGLIAEAFGALLQRIWDPLSTNASYSPREFKQVLQKFAPQFGGYQQHDSQELVAFLLDGLHEDLNRVLKKPYVEKPDWEGGGERELVALARRSWEGYMMRNDSVIVDLFQGQYQSTLVCPECQKISITFDPFMYLTLPLPFDKKTIHEVYYIPWDITKPHVKVPVELSRDSTFKEVRQLLGRWMKANPDHLLTVEIYNNRFYKSLHDRVAWGEMSDNDVLVCYELPCPTQQTGVPSYQPNRQPGDPFIIPVFLCDTIRAQRQTYSSNTILFGYPFFIAVDEQQACSKEALYEAVLSRLERWTENAQDLSKWEIGPLGDPMEGVAIPITNPTLADSTVEIYENGEVIPADEVPTEEGDIADEKDFVIRETDGDKKYIPDGPPRRVGFKADIFHLHVQAHSTAHGIGYGSFGPARSHFQPWEQREEEAQNLPEPVLIRLHDVFVCEFDENMKAYYFGDVHNHYEHAKWERWEEFVHPDFVTSREATKMRKNKTITLQDCLDEFTKEEKLGEEDPWYCPRCKKHQQATKRFDIWKLPDILVVHLKRFSNNRTLRDKIDSFVDFPIEGLDLTPMVGERRVAKQLAVEGTDLGFGDIDEPLVYDLYAVDEHIGGLGGGHYRAYAYNHATDGWYHFDDSYVTPARPEAAVNANAYLLFYKRRTTHPIGGQSHKKVEAARQRPVALEPDGALEEPQLPTPPSEPLGPLIALPRSIGLDTEDNFSPNARSSPASTSSTPLPMDDGDPPSFEDAALDPILLSNQRYDFPDPSNSPTSSLEAEIDSDDLDPIPPTRVRPARWPSEPRESTEGDGTFSTQLDSDLDDVPPDLSHDTRID